MSYYDREVSIDKNKLYQELSNIKYNINLIKELNLGNWKQRVEIITDQINTSVDNIKNSLE